MESLQIGNQRDVYLHERGPQKETHVSTPRVEVTSNSSSLMELSVHVRFITSVWSLVVLP